MVVLSFNKAIDGFTRYLEAERGCSPLTIQEYRRDLSLLRDYLSEDKLDIKNIKVSDIASFLEHAVFEEENSLVTRNRKLYTLRSFYNYLNKRGLINKNPALNIESAKTKTKAEPEYLDKEEVGRLLEAVKLSSSRTTKRDEAIIKTFVYCGLRVSELVALNINSIDFGEPSIKFFGKGDRERKVPLHPEALQSIEAYIENRNILQVEETTRALFLSTWGKRISVRTVQLLVKSYAEEAGLKNASEVTPNKLRHTFASHFYGKTKNIKVLQELLGHSNVTTTQIYTHTDQEQHKNAIGEMPVF